MDIYGYPSYPYNQSDEMAKQMFAQQALTVPYGRVPGPHALPAPTGAPWNMQGVSWGLQSPPHLVEFTASPDKIVHCKRKSFDLIPAVPAKQLITEERMAAHLNGLHISSEYKPHSLAKPEETMEISMDANAAAICEKLKGHTIVLSDEVKKLKDEPLLPAALIERLEKPRMSLVLWKPKEDIITKLKELPEDKEKSEEEPKKTGVLVPDMSNMDIEM